MNIHEYQSKAVLKSFGAPVSEGQPALTVKEAVAAAKNLPGPVYVVKSQIHAGGRGKGKFKEFPLFLDRFRHFLLVAHSRCISGTHTEVAFHLPECF
jgi:hypothetical protein